MVRTKDLLLIVVILVMLFMAISATVVSRMVVGQKHEEVLSGTVDAAPTYEVGSSGLASIDRTANIARLRDLLAAGDVIESSPSVEGSPVPEDETTIGGESVCSGLGSGIEVARSWPLGGVTVKTVGARRVVVHTAVPETVPGAIGTGTLPTVPSSERILLSLPLYPIKQADQTCMNSEIVGVTAAGSLLFNNDIVLYRQTSSESLIGYALDGFPIYGAFTGEVDGCGGYDSPTGYRYVVSPQSSTLINCFVGSPQSFSF